MKVIFMFGGLLQYFITAHNHPFGKDRAWAKFRADTKYVKSYTYEELIKLIKKL